MSSENVIITDEASHGLNRMLEKCKRPASLMKRLGKTVEVELRRHFSVLNRIPNKRGFRKTNFWNRIRNSTTFTKFDANSAEVSIQDGAFAAKLHGATIRPTGGRKFLAIPAVSSRNGISPRSANDQASFFFYRTKAGKPTLAMNRRGNVEIQYFLIRSAKVPKEPNALPKAEVISRKLAEKAGEYLENER